MEGKKKSTTALGKSSPAKKSADPAPPSTEFILHAPDAREVFVAGEFNSWNSTQYPMRKFKGDIWKKSLKLKKGRYEYKFIVDGDWRIDPKNPERQTTPFGVENSIVLVF